MDLLWLFGFKALAVIAGTAFYSMGEEFNKKLKWWMGIPISIFCGLALESPIPLFCIVTYLIATEIPYGANDWWTKLIGNRVAITVCGFAIGLAAFPVIGMWAIANAIFSGTCWCIISIFDDKGKIVEPYVGLLRGFTGLAGLMI